MRGRCGTILLAGVAAVLAGCRTEVVPAERPRARTVRVEDATSGTRPPPRPGERAAAAPPPAAQVSIPAAEPEDLIAEDPCAARLHDIAGTMLLYYALHKRLPAELDQLHGLADVELAFTCPTSGRPYVYVPSGLSYPGKEERLVLHDAAPAHDGARWGILAAPPRGKRPAATWAVRLTDNVFRAYAAPVGSEEPSDGAR